MHREPDLTIVSPVPFDVVNMVHGSSANLVPQSVTPSGNTNTSEVVVLVVVVLVGLVLVTGTVVVVAFVLRKRSSSKYETQEDEHVAEVRRRVRC